MNPHDFERLAQQLIRGEISPAGLMDEFLRSRTLDVGDAQIDLDRRRRCGFPEVIFGEGKTVEAIHRIATALLEDGVDVLATRVTPEQAAVLEGHFPDARYNPLGRTFRIPQTTTDRSPSTDDQQDRGRVTIVTAGTSD